MFEFQKDCGLQIVKELVEGEKNLSRIYGFILYTEKNPYVVKVLQDNTFWNALNSLSGSNWPIFAVRPLRQGNKEIIGAGSGYTGFCVETWNEPAENLPVLKDFRLENTEELPLFVAFMWDDNDELNEVTIPIQGSNLDSTYHSLEEIVKAITRVENAILPEYKKTVNVFRNVKAELDSLKYKYRAIQRGKIIKKIADMLSVFV
jgi:hypothetical protein